MSGIPMVMHDLLLAACPLSLFVQQAQGEWL